MRSIAREFPNPVLTADGTDYINSCTFEISLDSEGITEDPENICVPVDYEMSCEGIKNYIDLDKAGVTVQATSPAASYSRVFSFSKDDTHAVLKIPKFDVVGKIELEGLVIAKDAIEHFDCPGELNETFFGSQDFEIRKGDVLAYDAGQVLYIDDSELEKPLSSIFSIRRVEEQEEDINTDFDTPDSGKIRIDLKPELFDLYNEFKDYSNGSLRRYVTAVIVYPVLIEALGFIRAAGNEADEIAELRWYRTIEAKLKKMGYADMRAAVECESLTTLADCLLGNIASDALKNFKEVLEAEMNSGEEEMLGGVD